MAGEKELRCLLAGTQISDAVEGLRDILASYESEKKVPDKEDRDILIAFYKSLEDSIAAAKKDCDLNTSGLAEVNGLTVDQNMTELGNLLRHGGTTPSSRWLYYFHAGLYASAIHDTIQATAAIGSGMNWEIESMLAD